MIGILEFGIVKNNSAVWHVPLQQKTATIHYTDSQRRLYSLLNSQSYRFELSGLIFVALFSIARRLTRYLTKGYSNGMTQNGHTKLLLKLQCKLFQSKYRNANLMGNRHSQKNIQKSLKLLPFCTEDFEKCYSKDIYIK